ncbi:NADPH:quinone reductase [Streptomyces sp. NPDC058440]|uniref:NADPH:quinone reductase n=1 Tax=Streptomyces sp. NPDC058440 TaxID=3346501 RepID=UPI00365A1693
MKAIVYRSTGGPEVLELVERTTPEPGQGEVRVEVRVSGVNPTDWKARRGSRGGTEGAEQVPNQDGAGVVDAVGEGVDPALVGQRVWIWEAAWQRPDGTAQEYVVLPLRQVVPLPDDASFELGASLGIPALTAHRCLTVAEGGPERLGPGVLAGRTVLVAGGAGAVGNAAIQLARWAGATVITTVSGPEKAALARAAGAQHVVNYRTEDAAAAIRAVAPDGVDVVVEVAPAPNAKLNVAVLASHGTVAVYANDGGDGLTLPVLPLMFGNLRLQGVMVYTVPVAAKDHAVAGVSAAVADGALRVGEQAGLPLHRFPIERVADAHAAVEQGAVGKVLIELS